MAAVCIFRINIIAKIVWLFQSVVDSQIKICILNNVCYYKCGNEIFFYRALKGNEVYISYLFFNVSNTSKGLYYFPEIAVEL